VEELRVIGEPFASREIEIRSIEGAAVQVPHPAAVVDHAPGRFDPKRQPIFAESEAVPAHVAEFVLAEGEDHQVRIQGKAVLPEIDQVAVGAPARYARIQHLDPVPLPLELGLEPRWKGLPVLDSVSEDEGVADHQDSVDVRSFPGGGGGTPQTQGVGGDAHRVLVGHLEGLPVRPDPVAQNSVRAVWIETHLGAAVLLHHDVPGGGDRTEDELGNQKTEQDRAEENREVAQKAHHIAARP
jgi:hypothetical protein